MSNNFSKRPVRFQPENAELIKSMGYEEAKDATDYVNDTNVVSVAPGVNSSYRTPPDRVNGNKLFRRYLDGHLDMEHATHIVIDAVHKLKHGGPLNDLEKVALQVLFPGNFGGTYMDQAMAASVASVQLDLLPQEQALIRIKCAAHFAEEMNWNAGQGGGSVPGRSQTYG